MKRNMRKYYKVVSVYKDDEFASVCGSLPETTLSYKIGKTTTPKIAGSNIMVFNCVAAARIAINTHWDNIDTVILECEVTKPSKTGIFFYYHNDMYRLSKVAQLRLRKKKYSHLIEQDYGPPKGTIFCSSVKPIKLVSKHNAIISNSWS